MPSRSHLAALLGMLFGAALLSAGLLAQSATAPSDPNPTTPTALTLTGDAPLTHDPSIARDGNTYYVFATGKAPDGGQFPVRCSTDLTSWKLCGHVFDSIPQWIQQRSPGTKELWAPDISHEHGEFRLYYAYSLFGKNTSGIALATNKTLDPHSPDYKWVDKGLVLESVTTDDFNAIDPNYIEDQQGHAWLAFGSFWGGIKMRALDGSTGLLSKSDTRLYDLAARAKPASATPTQARPDLAAPAHTTLPPDTEAIEAPFVIRHDGFFYLFVSWDLCCRGTKSTYRTMVGRSRSVTGPYLDQAGKPMSEGGGTALLSANARWLGPGGESVLVRTDAPDLLVFHAYDSTTGKPSLQISTLSWRNGWPLAALATH